MLKGFLELIYILASGVTPHTLDLLACLGVATILLGGLAAFLLACELAARVVRPVARRRRLRRRLAELEEGTCDGLSRFERARLSDEIVRDLRERT